MDIFVSLDLLEELRSHGIVLSIAEYKMLIWHLDEGLDNQIYSLGRRESCPGVEILSSRKWNIYRKSRVSWSKEGSIRRRIDDLTLISTIGEQSIMHILRVRDDSIHLREEISILLSLLIEDMMCYRMEESG